MASIILLSGVRCSVLAVRLLLSMTLIDLSSVALPAGEAGIAKEGGCRLFAAGLPLKEDDLGLLTADC